ncbi:MULTISPECIES: recombinase family protein [Novosphingobium]|uniref:Recombinase family protein n=1 Tax=Novosphingobium olei TaxID=2728851 RepID=A0A7Y0BSG4_9SPHN|nr:MULTISPECIES: recombinase family protein [Novosphingobium]NML95101.1 recombinase family protein [Novosphingobium olei]QOV96778.1 recombinase family protein [Novosphingobium sp. ES2-1]
MALIGYARVSTDEQDTVAQQDALRVQGCVEIFEDKASGASKERPNLARALGRAGQGDTLLVVRIDRLARSLSHLLEIVETLRGKGAYFRSIHDPIDTSSAQGMLMTQMLGAFAEFERALIRERTRAGIKAAVARGAKPGNPRMRERDPVAISNIRVSHNERHLNELLDGRHRWLPTVERLRPHLPWALVLRQVLAITPPVRSFSERTLVKACRNLVRASVANPAILQKSPRLPPDTRVARLVADRLNTHPDATLRDIATWLSRDLREPTPRDGLCWTPESVRRVISQARALHLVA